MADRKAHYTKLPDRLKKINSALVELNEVITGGAFDENQIWGDGVGEIKDYMDGMTVTAELHNAVKKLLGGLGIDSGVSTAIDAAMKGLQGVIADIDKTVSDLGVGDRVTAFKQLITPHAAGSYGTNAADNFGFFPAIEGVINAAAGTNADSSGILGPLQQVMDLASDAEAIEDFVKFATSTVQLLGKALNAA